jgi:ABC-type nitrate/sulfonate/bicarbonate transport system substrate-binding protein
MVTRTGSSSRRLPWRRGAGQLSLMALVGLLVLAGCSGTPAPAARTGQLTNVTLALDYVPNTNHTGIYVALQKGWYREAGINLTLLQPGATAPEQLVGAGQADFGISFTEGVTSSRAAGVPIVSIAAIIQHNTSELIALKSSGLDSVAKLAGKRYAGFGAPEYEKPVIALALSCGGAANPSFQYTATAVTALTALTSGQFDFAWVFHAYDTTAAQQQGIALNVFPITDYCVPDYYTPVIITNQQLIKQHPDLITRFMRATAEGYNYAIAHPHAAADLMVAGAPKGSFNGTAFVYASQDYLSPLYATGAKCWGEQSLDKWTNYPRFMYVHGALTDASGNPLTSPPDFAAAFTNQFLPAC